MSWSDRKLASRKKKKNTKIKKINEVFTDHTDPASCSGVRSDIRHATRRGER